jgi:hypothetical protein
MLGFNPFSTNPLSDILLPAITGTINATDGNDTASITGNVVTSGVTGTISATDGNDTANITGVVLIPITGTISATDGNDTSSIEGFVGVPLTGDTHDGFTPQEIKRAKALDAKIAKLERQRLDAYRKSQSDRKAAIKELVDPTPKSKQKKNKVQSNQEVSEDIPSEITALDNTIANLVKQQQELLHGVMLRQELVRIQTEMAILEAKRMQELDDEEALLLLL